VKRRDCIGNKRSIQIDRNPWVKSEVRWSMKKSLLLLVVLFLSVFAAGAWGEATRSLRGAMIYPGGSTVPGAQVTIVNTATSFTRTATTKNDGTYTFVEVIPGTYNVTVEATGFQKYEQLGVILRVELPATINVQLKVGKVSEVVSVNAEAAPMLNTTDATMGQTMETNAIENLPLPAENNPFWMGVQVLPASVVFRMVGHAPVTSPAA